MSGKNNVAFTLAILALAFASGCSHHGGEIRISRVPYASLPTFQETPILPPLPPSVPVTPMVVTESNQPPLNPPIQIQGSWKGVDEKSATLPIPNKKN